MFAGSGVRSIMSSIVGKSTWIAVAIAAAGLIAVVAVVASVWAALGDIGMSAAGWVAMALGIVATLVLGIALMALVFISNRRGYDEEAGGEPGGQRR
jgi:hypothetical protein